MIRSVILALFLPCAGMMGILIIYICLLCYAGWYHQQQSTATPVNKPPTEPGLSKTQLEKLPVVIGKDLVMDMECAVCLDDIEPEQPARMLPGCNHGFHLQCADTWLSKNPVCPVCRNKLDAGFFAPPEENPC